MSDAIRYAMIRNGVVENVSLWDGDTSRWQPPAEYITIPAPDHVGRDWLYDGFTWSPPVPAPETEIVPTPTEE